MANVDLSGLRLSGLRRCCKAAMRPPCRCVPPDPHAGDRRQEYHTAIEKSTCLYVGNLSYYTAESQIYEFFGRCGEVRPRCSCLAPDLVRPLAKPFARPWIGFVP